MMIQHAPPFCRALRIDSILKILQGWKLDVSLQPAPPREGELPATRALTVAVMGFDNRSTKVLPSLGFVAQDITTSFLHTLPGVVLVSRDRLEAVREEGRLLGDLLTPEGITEAGQLLQADALVTGSIVRYDVERRTLKAYGTSALIDVFHMALTLQILEVKTGRVQFSKNFEVERTKQYPKISSSPDQPLDLTSELLEALLDQAQPDIRSALAQLREGQKPGQFINVPVISSPAGADVILNGTFMGRTPLTLQLTLAPHEIQVILPGYTPWSRKFRAEPGKRIEATLVPLEH